MSLASQVSLLATRIATQFNTVSGLIAAKAPLASPALTGTPTAPTPAAGDNDTSIATTAFVTSAIDVNGLGVVAVISDGSPVPSGTPAGLVVRLE